MGKAVKPLLCHMTGGNQYWMFRTDGKILRDYLCIGRQVASICTFFQLSKNHEIRDLGTNIPNIHGGFHTEKTGYITLRNGVSQN